MNEPADVLAVGCGPFNLGLAALASELDQIEVTVLDENPEFTWHRGLMFDDALLQVSFLADLTSLVDPRHKLSFLSYLQDRDRLYHFYVRESFHPTRREYEDYLRWAAGRLPGLRFASRVESVRWLPEVERFAVRSVEPDGERVRTARHLALGVGTAPRIPTALAGLPAELLVHSSDYLHRRAELETGERVAVVGSGQSGAEIALDLLRRDRVELAWLTRTESFAPLDYTKLVLEMTTPDYVDYFHALPEKTRDRLVAEQWRHYKGISAETIEQIHDELYRRKVRGADLPELRSSSAVERAEFVDGAVTLHCRAEDAGESFTVRCDRVVAATGYSHRPPSFLKPLDEYLRRDRAGRYELRRDHSIVADEALTGKIFVANADLHTHGVAAPDLGIAAVRNAAILNAAAGKELLPLPKNTAFTSFGGKRIE